MAKNDWHSSVPVPLFEGYKGQWAECLVEMKRIGAQRVMLFAGDGPTVENAEKTAEQLVRGREFFEKQGIEVAFWTITIGHTERLSGSREETRFQEIVGAQGQAAHGCFCPMDERFRRRTREALATMAQSKVGLMLLDDDYRLALHGAGGAGCFCDLHVEALSKRVGRKLTREEIVREALTGEPRPLRQEWLAMNGELLTKFAGEIERAVHEVSPKTRVGLCLVHTLWEGEGVDVPKLVKAFAGKTRPFIRLIGAPYWAGSGRDLGAVLEMVRMEEEWLKGFDAEMVVEGDTWPHTRWYCPAAIMHGYQQWLLATGTRGFLNYALTYSPPPAHEPGYVTKMVKSMENYKEIAEFFGTEGTERGVTVVDPAYSFAWRTLPENEGGVQHQVKKGLEGERWMVRMGIPIAHGDETGPVVMVGTYGEGLGEAELEKLLKRGALVDATAAKWLMKRGVDVGIESVEETVKQVYEEYSDEEFSGPYHGHKVWLFAGDAPKFHRARVKKGARVISEFLNGEGGERIPATVLYEDGRGRRFCVLTADVWGPRHDDGGGQTHLNYARQEQVQRCLGWVGRKPLPATAPGQPDVHVMCRETDNGRWVIAVQNLHMDEIEELVLRLDGGITVKGAIEVLEPEADLERRTKDYEYRTEGKYGYLKLKMKVPTMGMVGIALGG